MPRLPPSPALVWSDAGVPSADAFDDVYFSRDGGLAESDAVFLGGCDLPNAWRGKDRFAIGELGFGAGVNVLATWRAWRATREPHAYLHICTVEAFPLARDDAARALAAFPEIAHLSERLLAQWPVRCSAPQRLWFEDDRFALTVLTGDVESSLAGMSGSFDAWYLDGFAPAKNPAMWSESVVRQIARLSHERTRVATFTVAGDVRRALESNGFAVERKPGFGKKRERLEVARIQAPAAKPRATLYPYAPSHPKRVAVLGAGIAGASCAYALTKRGVETVVLDAARELGAGASGNPAGLVMPRLDRAASGLSEMFLAAYLEAVATYDRLGVFSACGVEERAEARKEVALADLLADPPLPGDWLSALPDGAALHARAGVVRPVDAVSKLMSGATLMCEAMVAHIERDGDAWLVRAPDGRAWLKADAVVLACGPALTTFEPAKFLPITLSRGQIEWGAGPVPTRAMTRSSYVAPLDGGVFFGATFDNLAADVAPAVNAESNSRTRNLRALARLAPEIADTLDVTTLHSRAAIRAVTTDKAPIAGLLPDAPAWLEQNKAISTGAKPPDLPAPAHVGVYVIGGLGARGLTLAPLLGERIAAEVCGDPQVLSQAALDAIHPARFLHRALKRR